MAARPVNRRRIEVKLIKSHHVANNPRVDGTVSGG